jgi:hypothetical protein
MDWWQWQHLIHKAVPHTKPQLRLWAESVVWWDICPTVKLKRMREKVDEYSVKQTHTAAELYGVLLAIGYTCDHLRKRFDWNVAKLPAKTDEQIVERMGTILPGEGTRTL